MSKVKSFKSLLKTSLKNIFLSANVLDQIFGIHTERDPPHCGFVIYLTLIVVFYCLDMWDVPGLCLSLPLPTMPIWWPSEHGRSSYATSLLLQRVFLCNESSYATSLLLYRRILLCTILPSLLYRIILFKKITFTQVYCTCILHCYIFKH